MIIKFNTINSSLGTRSLGREIREHTIISFSTTAERIIFDFEGVEVISNSFADECFGKLIQTFGLDFTKNRTTFKNTNSNVAMVLKKAMSDRLAMLREECTCR